MTKINSLAIGKGSGSAGNLTYRPWRDETVISQKITQNGSRTPEQINHRMGFSGMVKISKSVRLLSDVGFEKNKKGSPSNNFLSNNTSLLDYIKSSPYYDPELAGVTSLCRALGDPDFKGKVYASVGSYDLMNEFEWDQNNNIRGTMYFSRDFVIGDKVYIGACISYMLKGRYFEQSSIFSQEFTKQNIRRLKYKNQFVFSSNDYPDMKILGNLPPGAEVRDVVATAIVSGKTNRSTSVFTLMPEIAPHLSISEQTLDDNRHMRLIAADPDAFAELFYEEPEGCVMYLPFGKNFPEGNRFPVLEFTRDSNQRLNGIIIGPDSIMNFSIPFRGSDAGNAAIYKDDTMLATLDGVLRPIMGS